MAAIVLRDLARRPPAIHALGETPVPTPNELYDQAVDLRDAGDKPGAVAKLDEALGVDPNFTLAHGMLAKLHADLSQFDQAIEHARKVVELEPNDVFSYTALSVIYQRCGKIHEAEEAKAKAYYKQMGYE
jgi:Flp pilus assembly protein TadD